jgi:HEAT repeat protein
VKFSILNNDKEYGPVSSDLTSTDTRTGISSLASGLATTLELLTNTDNEAAVQVLIPALDCPDPVVQEGALVALLKRRTAAGGREIIDRLAQMKPEWKTIVRQHRSRMTGAIRDAILDENDSVCEKGCRAAVTFRDYDLISTLLTVLDSPDQPHGELAANTVLELVQALCEELAGGRDPSDRRDPQMVRRYVLGSLESSVHRFGQHKRREVVESFLLLVDRENAALRQMLGNGHHTAFAAIIEGLAKSPQRGVLKLLLSFLDDPHAPASTFSVLGSRSDTRFVHYLMRKIGREPAAVLAANLKRITSIPWLADCRRVIDQLDDAGQHSAIRFVMASGVPRQQAFTVIENVLLNGKPGGRREAARALADFPGNDANNLAMRALGDPDPQVQANLIPQLRSRGIPGVLQNLLVLIESPYAVVRKAARESLTEFSFKRFVAAFDMLDDDVRRSTGTLVKKIDPQSVMLLNDELRSPIRTRRLRGLAIAKAIECVESVEGAIIEMLEDEDHLVRMEAAATLAYGVTPATTMALQRALEDSSEVVRAAAERSLAESARHREAAQARGADNMAAALANLRGAT